MRSSDKLIRHQCPACRAEITLGRSSLNKKIQCPKCRQAVVIHEEAPAFVAHVPDHATTIRSSGFHLSQETTLPVETQPVMQTRRSPETQVAAGQQEDTGREPIVYCLCNGVLKRRIISKAWGPSRNLCCMCREEATG
jgi:uncharacterized protein YbaR (Trm112 family)